MKTYLPYVTWRQLCVPYEKKLERSLSRTHTTYVTSYDIPRLHVYEAYALRTTTQNTKSIDTRARQASGFIQGRAWGRWSTGPLRIAVPVGPHIHSYLEGPTRGLCAAQ